MDLRKRLFIIISLVVGIILVIVLVAIYFPKKNAGNEGNGTNTQTGTNQNGQTGIVPGNTPQGTQQPVSLPPSTAARTNETIYIQQLASIFIERFQSYSNQNNNAQITDILSLATDRMSKWLMTQQVPQTPTGYEGVITRVVSTSVPSYEAGVRATVAFGVQEQHEKLGAESVQYRQGRVEMLYENNGWKVDGVYWN